jgi:S-(hydroxymethyl)glutathione dehydrogenase/alcohol dehydrogenase
MGLAAEETPMKAAIHHGTNLPMTVEEVEIDRPAAREVLVRTVASGVCHSDVHVIDGRFPLQGPLVIGHEGAGIVEAVGSDVTGFAPGDHVVACISAFCGQCEQCLTGHPNRCDDPGNRRSPSQPAKLTWRGRPLAQTTKYTNMASYAEKMLLPQQSVVKIPADFPLDQASLLSCGSLTGIGAVLNSARVEPGTTVAVFGCGTVGLSSVQAALIAGARMVIAIDLKDDKLELAKRLGATHTVNATRDDPVAFIKTATRNRGADYAFDTVGLKSIVSQCWDSLAIGGTVVMVGGLLGDSIELTGYGFIAERRVIGCGMGSNRFPLDVPRWIDFVRQGRLQLEPLIRHRTGLEGVNDALEAMKAGEGLHTVVVFDA